MNFKKAIKVAGAILATVGVGTVFGQQDVHADETNQRGVWVARSVEQIKADLHQAGENLNSYKIKWGDTLYAISLATDVSVESLAKINNIENVRLIEVDTTLYFSKDKSVITVNQGKEVKSYSTESGQEVETPKETKEEIKKEETATQTEQTGRWMTVTATAYSYLEPGLTAATAMGYDLRSTPNIIAVDPRVIPLGSRVYIPGYGEYIAGDTGGAIVGNKIDIHMTSIAAMNAFGVRTIQIQLLDK